MRRSDDFNFGSLALAALYLPAGALGDRYGYANTFVVGATGFAIASILAGLAPTSEVLIAARAVQGVFGALLTPGSLALLRATYKDEAGKALRVPGTNPFFPLPHELQGNRFLQLLRTHSIDVYLMNTGWIVDDAPPRGKKISVEHSSACVRAIASRIPLLGAPLA